MNVQSNQLYVAAMRSATTSREPTAVSVLKDTSLQLMGRIVLVSFLKSTAHWAFGLSFISQGQKTTLGICSDFLHELNLGTHAAGSGTIH